MYVEYIVVNNKNITKNKIQKKCNKIWARLAQTVERMTLNHVVVGSIPTVGVSFSLTVLCFYIFCKKS